MGCRRGARGGGNGGRKRAQFGGGGERRKRAECCRKRGSYAWSARGRDAGARRKQEVASSGGDARAAREQGRALVGGGRDREAHAWASPVKKENGPGPKKK
jgi:hypothetical protein